MSLLPSPAVWSPPRDEAHLARPPCRADRHALPFVKTVVSCGRQGRIARVPWRQLDDLHPVLVVDRYRRATRIVVHDINIAAAGRHSFTRFCQTLGLARLLEDPLFADEASRSKNRLAINQIISDVTRKQSSSELIAKLNKAGVPCGPINRIDEVFADPQVKHLGMAAPVQHGSLGDIEVVNQPVKLSRTPSHIAHPTPEKGEHTEEVLKDYGYDDEAIANFRARKIV